VYNKGKRNKLECLIFNICKIIFYDLVYEKYGKDWKIISKYLITWTVQQIISHSQKIENKRRIITNNDEIGNKQNENS